MCVIRAPSIRGLASVCETPYTQRNKIIEIMHLKLLNLQQIFCSGKWSSAVQCTASHRVMAVELCTVWACVRVCQRDWFWCICDQVRARSHTHTHLIQQSQSMPSQVESSRVESNQAKHHTKAKWSAEFATAATLAPAEASRIMKKKAADHQHRNARKSNERTAHKMQERLGQRSHKQVGWSSVNLVQISFEDLQLLFSFLFIFLSLLLLLVLFLYWVPTFFTFDST